MKKIIHIREVPNNSIEARIAIFVITRYANKIISIDPISNEAFSNLKKSVVIFNPFNMKRARQLREKKDEIKLKYKIQPATFVISIIGRIEEPKGHNLLFEIVEKFTNQNLFFLIVGLPSGVYGKKFLEKSYHYKNIKYIGEINEIEEIYAITDIILRLDTVDYLPLGRTVWEGLFAGCICVIPVKRSFNIYPIQHLINKYIFVYKYCDPENLINMLKQIISEQSDTIQNTSYPIMDNSEENALQFDKILRDLS
jgi:glycosyltransferase involved in cell wall biosynthesis